MKSILHNKYVLYAVFILALIDFLYLGYIQDMKSVFIFVLVGILVTFFNKNMIIVLGLAVIVTNVIKLGNIIPASNKEGFTDDKEDDEEQEDDNKEDKKKNGKKSKDDKEDKKEDDKEHEDEDKKTDEQEDKDEKKKKEEFGQDKDVVYTSAEDQSVNDQEKMILANENLLKRMNKYKPLLDTLNGLTKNIAIVKGFASSVSEDVNKKI